MKINVKKEETATIEFSIKDLKKYFGEKLKDFDLEGFSIIKIEETTRNAFIQGADPHDGYTEKYFDGIKIKLKK